MTSANPLTENHAQAQPAEPTPSDFMRNLEAELAAGEVRLPSIPEVAERVQRALDDERATPTIVAQVVATDAALAARVLRLANSAAFNPSGQPVTDLPTAITRLGHQLVRCAAVAFALKQLKLSGGQGALQPQLQELWRKGTLVASLAYVLARDTKAVNPDEALVTGLLHNVGRLYVLVRAHDHGTAFASGAAWDRVLHDWHPRIARAILQHWNFPAEIADAIGDQNAWDGPNPRAERLTDILVAATSLVPCAFYRELLDDTVTSVAPFQRLDLTAEDCRRLLAGTAQQVKSLRDALLG
jgi:HD-like signal output (HDOD) protein